MKKVQRWCALLIVAMLVTVLTGTVGPTASAEDQLPVGGALTSGPATLVPAAAQRALPRGKGAPAPAGAEAIPFRPTADAAEYQAGKAAAQGARQAARATGGTPAALAPPTLSIGPIDGVDQTVGCTFATFRCVPPDPHLAAGGGASRHIVEIGNSFISVYDRGGSQLLVTSLNAFFNRPPPQTIQDILFDPRVVYDTVWNRWVVTAEEFQRSPTEQYFDIGVSLTDDATGPYYLYRINVTLFAGLFFDYPQLGLDQDAVIVTANIFGAVSFAYAEVFAIAKARLYNGLGFTVPVFIDLEGTLAPPIVQDQNPLTYLIADQVAGTGPSTTLALYAMRETARPAATSIVRRPDVVVAPYSFPRDADQPDTRVLLDTLDGRFVNASTQVGNLLYQVHTVAFNGQPGGQPTPRWYKINVATSTALVQQFFYASNSSNDWNASIAANARDEVFVTWTSDEPGRVPVYPEVRFSGKGAEDATIALGGTAVERSPTFYQQSTTPPVVARWGDYSAVALDPVGTPTCAPFRQAWLVNQKAKDPLTWGTTIAQIGFCR